MILQFLLLCLASSVKEPTSRFWATDVGKFLGEKKHFLRAESVASYGGVYKYRDTLDGDSYTISEVWDNFKPLNCKGVLANSRFFVVARVCYDNRAFLKKEVENGEIFVRYGAFSQLHDGRFEKIEQIRIQYFHVVLKAKGEFILSVYSKPAAMMNWDEQTWNIWEKTTPRPADEKERCIIVGPQKQNAIRGYTKSYSSDEKKSEIKVQHFGKTRETGRNYDDFKGKTEVYWQNAIVPEVTDEGAPAYCWLFGAQDWKFFGFVSNPIVHTGKNKHGQTVRHGVIESIYEEFTSIKEEKPEFFEYAKPIWEKINKNMIGRNELRNDEL